MTVLPEQTGRIIEALDVLRIGPEETSETNGDVGSQFLS